MLNGSCSSLSLFSNVFLLQILGNIKLLFRPQYQIDPRNICDLCRLELSVTANYNHHGFWIDAQSLSYHRSALLVSIIGHRACVDHKYIGMVLKSNTAITSVLKITSYRARFREIELTAQCVKCYFLELKHAAKVLWFSHSKQGQKERINYFRFRNWPRDMKRISIQFCFVLAFLFLSSLTSAQDKVEREYKINQREVPQEAQDFIFETGILYPKTKVQWFREESASDESVEAKFRQDRYRYSIEFSKDGQLQDVEIEIPFSEIPSSTQEIIEVALDSVFVKWRISKVQRQWVGDPEMVVESIKKFEPASDVQENYEMVIKGDTGSNRSYFELLFSQSGELLRKSRIRQNSLDILIY